MNPFTSFAIMSILYAVKMGKEYTCERRSESAHGKPCDMCIPGEDKNKRSGCCYRNMCLSLALLSCARRYADLIKEPEDGRGVLTWFLWFEQAHDCKGENMYRMKSRLP